MGAGVKWHKEYAVMPGSEEHARSHRDFRSVEEVGKHTVQVNVATASNLLIEEPPNTLVSGRGVHY
jgi:hypothetical protein